MGRGGALRLSGFAKTLSRRPPLLLRRQARGLGFACALVLVLAQAFFSAFRGRVIGQKTLRLKGKGLLTYLKKSKTARAVCLAPLLILSLIGLPGRLVAFQPRLGSNPFSLGFQPSLAGFSRDSLRQRGSFLSVMSFSFSPFGQARGCALVLCL